jgi:hypothetical protein
MLISKLRVPIVNEFHLVLISAQAPTDHACQFYCKLRVLNVHEFHPGTDFCASPY